MTNDPEDGLFFYYGRRSQKGRKTGTSADNFKKKRFRQPEEPPATGVRAALPREKRQPVLAPSKPPGYFVNTHFSVLTAPSSVPTRTK